MGTKLHWRTALLAIGIAVPIAVLAQWWSHDPPNLYRLAVATALAATLWWIAECFGVVTMRIAATVGAIVVVLALIRVGDNDRQADDNQLLAEARASVGVEIDNVVRIGDPLGSENALEAVRGDDARGAGGATDPSRQESNGEPATPELSEETVNDLLVAGLVEEQPSEPPVRARPEEELKADLTAVRGQVRQIDLDAACELAGVAQAADALTLPGTAGPASASPRFRLDLAPTRRLVCNAEEPRLVHAQLLNILRDQVAAAQTRTSNASMQAELGARLETLDLEIRELGNPVAVHRLVVEGADAVLGDALDPVVSDDIAARLGGWGWAIVAFVLILGYRRLEIINGKREPGPVGVSRPDESGMNDVERSDTRTAATVIENFLGQAELREPSTIPGGDATSQVAELMHDDGVPGGKTAQALMTFFQNTAFPAKGVVVVATVERFGTDDRTTFRVTARVSHARNKRLLYAQPFESANLTNAATKAAAFVATKTLADSRTTLPWARWADDDGTGLLAYQEVAMDERTREVRVPPVARRKRLETAVASCPYSGLARVALGQQLQLVGPLAETEAELLPPLEPEAQPPKPEVGRSLVTGLTHLAWATTEYPEFLIARYRLAASMSMLAEEIDQLWRFDLTDGSAPRPDKHRAFLGSSIVTREIADLLTRQARHRRRWAESGAPRPPTKVADERVGVRYRVYRVYNRSRFGSYLVGRLKHAEAERLVIEPPDVSVSDARSAADTSVDSEAGLAQVIEPHADRVATQRALLKLATIEVETGLWILRAYPVLRLWRQAERAYWLSLITNPGRKQRQRAAFRILSEIIKVRIATLEPVAGVDGEAPTAPRPEPLGDQLDRVERLQSKYRDDAVVSYAAASFCGVALSRVRDGRIETTDERTTARALAESAIRFLREARSSSDGFMVSSRWVMRDPDLWVLREVVPLEWDALIRHLRATEARLVDGAASSGIPVAANGSRQRRFATST